MWIPKCRSSGVDRLKWFETNIQLINYLLNSCLEPFAKTNSPFMIMTSSTQWMWNFGYFLSVDVICVIVEYVSLTICDNGLSVT